LPVWLVWQWFGALGTVLGSCGGGGLGRRKKVISLGRGREVVVVEAARSPDQLLGGLGRRRGVVEAAG